MTTRKPYPTPDEIAAALARHDFGGKEPVEWIQTHISHVFLVGDRVYKLRKAVRQPFLDFESREARNTDCLREVELNRRLAPDVYLGIAPVLTGEATIRLGPLSESVDEPDLEHVVVMRRLPSGRDALALLAEDALTPAQLETVASILARFHAEHSLGTPAPWSPEAWFDRTADPALECVEALRRSELVPSLRVDTLEKSVQTHLDRLRPRFETRRQEGRAVDAHGDLHLDHVWFETDDAPPLLIDCIEFNEALRQIDAASELAFLSMDLEYRGRRDLADCLLSAYATRSDDYGLFPVVDFFSAYRALVRAKVAALAASQSTIGEEQRKRAQGSIEGHLEIAEKLLANEHTPELIVLCGTVGSGKSTVARELARSGRGIQISSDRVRKKLAGISATTRLNESPDEGLYNPSNTEAVYRALLDRASQVILSGRTAILDASFARRTHRDQARAWAAEKGIAARLVEVCCDSETARERLVLRERSSQDPSDAGPDFLPISRSRYEAPDEWPERDREVVWTDRPEKDAT